MLAVAIKDVLLCSNLTSVFSIQFNNPNWYGDYRIQIFNLFNSSIGSRYASSASVQLKRLVLNEPCVAFALL